MKFLKRNFSATTLIIFAFTLSTSVVAQETRLANQAVVCSSIFEIAAASQKGTKVGDNANRWARDFKRLSMNEGMTAEKFAQNRDSFLKSMSNSGGNEVFNQALRGCLVTGEKVGIIKD